MFSFIELEFILYLFINYTHIEENLLVSRAFSNYFVCSESLYFGDTLHYIRRQL